MGEQGEKGEDRIGREGKGRERKGKNLKSLSTREAITAVLLI
jgi:hypothetical protein